MRLGPYHAPEGHDTDGVLVPDVGRRHRVVSQRLEVCGEDVPSAVPGPCARNDASGDWASTFFRAFFCCNGPSPRTFEGPRIVSGGMHSGSPSHVLCRRILFPGSTCRKSMCGAEGETIEYHDWKKGNGRMFLRDLALSPKFDLLEPSLKGGRILLHFLPAKCCKTRISDLQLCVTPSSASVCFVNRHKKFKFKSTTDHYGRFIPRAPCQSRGGPGSLWRGPSPGKILRTLPSRRNVTSLGYWRRGSGVMGQGGPGPSGELS